MCLSIKEEWKWSLRTAHYLYHHHHHHPLHLGGLSSPWWFPSLINELSFSAWSWHPKFSLAPAAPIPQCTVLKLLSFSIGNVIILIIIIIIIRYLHSIKFIQFNPLVAIWAIYWVHHNSGAIMALCIQAQPANVSKKTLILLRWFVLTF